MVIKDELQHSPGLGSVNEKNDPIAMQVGKGQGYTNKNPFLQCEDYGLKGHTKENCYKIIGYPEEFKGKKKFGSANMVMAMKRAIWSWYSIILQCCQQYMQKCRYLITGLFNQ